MVVRKITHANIYDLRRAACESMQIAGASMFGLRDPTVPLKASLYRDIMQCTVDLLDTLEDTQRQLYEARDKYTNTLEELTKLKQATSKDYRYV